MARKSRSFAASLRAKGGSWNSTGPSFSPRVSATSKRCATSSSAPARRFWCVMRCGALSTNVKPSGTCSPHLPTIFGSGIR